MLIIGLGINWVLILSLSPLYYCGFYVLIARVVGIKKQDLVTVLSLYTYRPWFWIKNRKQIDIKKLVILSKFNRNFIKDPWKFDGGNLYKREKSFVIVNEFKTVNYWFDIRLKSQDFSELIDQKFYQNIITDTLKWYGSQYGIKWSCFKYDFDTMILEITTAFTDIKWVCQIDFKGEPGGWIASNLLENNLVALLKKISKYQDWWNSPVNHQRCNFEKILNKYPCYLSVDFKTNIINYWDNDEIFNYQIPIKD